MMERSLEQERAFFDEQIGDAKRSLQETREFAEAFRNIAERLTAQEPTSPIAGNAQRYVLNFCEEMRERANDRATQKQRDIDKMQEDRP